MTNAYQCLQCYSILVEILRGNLYQSELLNQNIYMHKYFKPELIIVRKKNQNLDKSINLKNL